MYVSKYLIIQNNTVETLCTVAHLQVLWGKLTEYTTGHLSVQIVQTVQIERLLHTCTCDCDTQSLAEVKVAS